MKFLFPKQPAFFEYFKEQNKCIKEISKLFSEFSQNFSESEKYWNEAKKIEHKADQITRTIIKELNDSFITPFDREDIYSLAERMDDVVDLIENAIQNIFLYEIKEKKEVIDEFAKIILEAGEDLDRLVQECFKKKVNTASINDWIIKIHDLEDQGDLAFQRAIKEIFEQSENPVEIMKWKDVIEDLENIMDQYKKVSSSVVGVIVKSC
jgi:uncharacterized protein